MTNKELDLAFEFVENTSRNLFLTGKAGTGKTTFLRHIKENSNKRLIIVAPTGVAAINAKGVTIHSFFQVPFGPIIPGDKLLLKQNMRSNKINIIRSLDLLIIDEISMVRADLLDAIDTILKRYKNRYKPFGGIQVILIGDVQQLPPVTRQNEWQLLSDYYKTPYFFSSKSYSEANFINIELKKIYRQENEDFLEILEKIRNDNADNHSLEKLNKRYFPDFDPDTNEGFITLTTHNDKAESINNSKLRSLYGKSKTYKARVQDNFPEYSYPAPDKLELKTGAQVMFIKNDSSPEKRYYNGKIGTVIELHEDFVIVSDSEDEDNEITVRTELWDNIQYSINPDNKELVEELLGTFEQIPLKLAWAITIHKSQGLTFDKVIIDAKFAFAHGQTYVALSRCRTLEGIILKSKIDNSAIINDTKVLDFNEKVRENTPDDSELNDSKKGFQIELLNELFDYKPLIHPLNNIISIFENNQKNLKGNIKESLIELKYYLDNELIPVSDKFMKYIEISTVNLLPNENPDIINRTERAVKFYSDELNNKIYTKTNSFKYNTDNKDINNDIEKHLKRIEDFVDQKIFCLKGLNEKFSLQKYMELRAKASIEKEVKTKHKKRKELQMETNHPELFKLLRNFRTEQSNEEQIDQFQIFPQFAMYDMCDKLPISLPQLKGINGIGKIRIKKYGKQIIKIIQDYCDSKNIFTTTENDKPIVEKTKKGETYRITLDMYNSGLKPEEIAKERNLALSTIESHLAKFILTGELSIHDFISQEKLNEFDIKTKGMDLNILNELKTKLGNDFSYGELRMIVNHKIPNKTK
ncbi:MAG: helix-turn-helix domain-containing protein [Saprospiraceae bacterium]